MSTYDPTAWAESAPVESLQGSYAMLGWNGPGAYRAALADAVGEALHQVYVDKGKPPSLLDVACFTGEYFGRLKETLAFPWQYTGVDVTPAYVDEARRRWPGARFEVGSAFALGKYQADVVLCAGLLIHMDDPGAVIRELLRVTKRALVVTATVNPLQAKDVVASEAEPFIVRVYKPGYIKGLLLKAVPKGAADDYRQVGDQGIWTVGL